MSLIHDHGYIAPYPGKRDISQCFGYTALCQGIQFDLEPNRGLSQIVLLLPLRMQFTNPTDGAAIHQDARRTSRM